MDGLLKKTDYPDLEVLVVDNASKEPKTLDYFNSLVRDPRVKLIEYPGKFNFSAINNFAVKATTGSIIGFINDDIEVIGPEWLREMVVHAARAHVGAVGAKLLYPDGRVQHGGVILGVQGVANHACASEMTSAVRPLTPVRGAFAGAFQTPRVASVRA